MRAYFEQECFAVKRRMFGYTCAQMVTHILFGPLCFLSSETMESWSTCPNMCDENVVRMLKVQVFMVVSC